MHILEHNIGREIHIGRNANSRNKWSSILRQQAVWLFESEINNARDK